MNVEHLALFARYRAYATGADAGGGSAHVPGMLLERGAELSKRLIAWLVHCHLHIGVSSRNGSLKNKEGHVAELFALQLRWRKPTSEKSGENRNGRASRIGASCAAPTTLRTSASAGVTKRSWAGFVVHDRLACHE